MVEEFFIKTPRGEIFVKKYEYCKESDYFLYINGLFDSINNSSIDNNTLGKMINQRKTNIIFFDFTCGEFKKGRSEGDIESCSLLTMIDDTKSVVKFLKFEKNIKSLSLVSHSTGCLVSYYILEEFHEYFNKNVWIAPTINNTKSVLNYMFKKSQNFSSINFTEKERENFTNSFNNEINSFINYKKLNIIIVPEHESKIRKEFAINFANTNKCRYYELENCNHLLQSKDFPNEIILNRLTKILTKLI